MGDGTGGAAARSVDTSGLDFIRAIVAEDVAAGKHGGRVMTRFPPEPNGYLHIGHAKSICLNFGVAAEHGGVCNVRFDDTNPTTEDVNYVEAIKQDVRWLGFDWGERLFHASDYFEQLYQYAVRLIRDGKAYVDSLSEDEIRDYRGTVTEPGRESPYRNRSVEENLDLFERMRAGEFPDGAHVLRAKIDMAARNMLMRDPVLYRIRHAHHYRTRDEWCIYPMYDYAHPLSDAIEGVTHSLCTLEFEINRELYDWVLDAAGFPRGARPEQTEFARLNLDYAVLSKRRLLALVNGGHVSDWDDPRMPTLAGLRRRGVTPEAIRAFCDMIGVAKTDSRVDIGKLEYCIRDHLNRAAPRVMCVLRPLRVVLVNYPEDRAEWLDAPDFPADVGREGSRKVPFSRLLYIERDDFMEDPPEGFFRLTPGREVRLRYAYFVRCVEVVKDEATGEVTELRCTYDPETRGGAAPDGREVKGTIHWVSAAHALTLEVRLYDRLFRVPDPDDVAEGQDFTANLKPESLVLIPDARVEPGVESALPLSHFQFERLGYFCVDPVDSRPHRPVFNRTVTLRDTWTRRAAQPARRRTGVAGRGAHAATAGTGAARSEKGVVGGGERSPAAPSVAARRTDAPAKELRDRTSPLPRRAERVARYTRELGLSAERARILVRDPAIARLFDDAVAAHANPQGIANWVINELPRELRGRTPEELPFGGAELGALIAMIDDGSVTTPIAKEVFAEMAARGGEPREIVERQGLEEIADPQALAPIITRLIAEYPDKARAYQQGRTGLLSFFVGQVMRETRGTANPKVAEEVVRQRLEGR
ncbi:MAG: glutamine--tRNA ligase/YqeY domain fusion protein [Gemmatimonadetes bacterium]|nr:glutamine--tRNA ligase/YqeY domain fusion protein [Gemmatimonadota bacterium]